MYRHPEDPGKTLSHCSLAPLLIEHFVRASGSLSSKQNPAVAKSPVSFHRCFPEWGAGDSMDHVACCSSALALPPPPAFLRALALASGAALSAFKGVLPLERGEGSGLPLDLGCRPKPGAEGASRPREPRPDWEARSEASCGLRGRGSFLI